MSEPTWSIRGVRGDRQLWRYMDMRKFEDLLTTSELYLSRCDGDWCEDKWEATLPLPIAKLGPSMKEGYAIFRRSGVICCWHDNLGESAAMWDLYCKRAGVAITTTAKRLRDALPSTGWENRVVGRVQYIDFSRLPKAFRPVGQNMMSPFFFFKRKSFEHEREVRLLERAGTWEKDFADSPAFIRLKVDLATLIQTVWVAPTDPEGILPAVQALVKKFLPASMKVVTSRLYDPNIY